MSAHFINTSHVQGSRNTDGLSFEQICTSICDALKNAKERIKTIWANCTCGFAKNEDFRNRASSAAHAVEIMGDAYVRMDTHIPIDVVSNVTNVTDPEVEALTEKLLTWQSEKFPALRAAYDLEVAQNIINQSERR